jgi:DUF1680 family protein
MSVGPVDAGASPHAVLRPLPQDTVVFAPAGVFGAWQQLNREATIDHCITEVEAAGVLDNLRQAAEPSDRVFAGFWFADSDLYKVLEAIAWETGRAGDDSWGEFRRQATEILRAAQAPDGYLNSWIQSGNGGERWQGLEMSHELYCAGHLIQAAVATDRATGDSSLLDIAIRLADLIATASNTADGPLIDGHPEIEMALVELYRHTGTQAYLDLAVQMVEARGRGRFEGKHFGRAYLQDHAPVREAIEATGHAVRQLYLAAGVADVYLETGDPSLLEANEKLWRSAFEQKTYITGGQGSRHRDEAFGDPYELPPDRAYAETCAGIASFMWNWRLLLATGKGKYADAMERVLLNTIAASTSLDGRHFFYSNVLQRRDGHDGTQEDAPSQRLEWYACACCPPNVARLVASLQHYAVTRNERGVQMHLFSQGSVDVAAPDGTGVHLEIDTSYPWSGRVDVTVDGGGAIWELALRIPRWCTAVTLSVDDEVLSIGADPDGYARIQRRWGSGIKVRLVLEMAPRWIGAHAHVDAVRGELALTRGPLVYCVEQIDQVPGISIDDLRVDPMNSVNVIAAPARIGAEVALAGEAQVLPPADQALYRALSDSEAAGSEQTRGTRVPFLAVPYFRWANRGDSPMRVWIPAVTS